MHTCNQRIGDGLQRWAATFRGILPWVVLTGVLVPALPARAATPPEDTLLLDGIAAVVNGEVITLGEVRRAAALLARQPGSQGPRCGSLAYGIGQVSQPDPAAAPVPEGEQVRAQPAAGEPRQARALECLIDQRLVFREVRRFPQLDVSRAELDRAWATLAESAGGEQVLAAEARRLGSTPQGVRADLRRQMLVTRYIDSRFRSTIEIDPDEAQRYYTDVLVPDMQRRGISPPPFATVAADFVEPILREREVNRRVQSWITDLRARANIVRKLR